MHSCVGDEDRVWVTLGTSSTSTIILYNLVYYRIYNYKIVVFYNKIVYTFLSYNNFVAFDNKNVVGALAATLVLRCQTVW